MLKEPTISLEEFEKLLEKSMPKAFETGDVVRGEVVKKENEGFLVDIGLKSEAFLPNREVSNSDKNVDEILSIGDVKDFYIIKDGQDDENILISLKKVSCALAWQKLQTAKVNNELVDAKIVSLVRGGVIVDVFDLKGFIPSSQLRTGAPFDGLINQSVPVKIIEADAKRNKLILSQRQALADQREHLVDELLASLQEDQIISGEVVRIADFGAFIDINGVDGLLPISEMSWQRIKHPGDIISLGQKLDVKVLKIDTDLKRISLSLKRMEDNPWEEIKNQLKEGDVIKGTVNKVASFGAFINIFPGVEALLPVAEMEENINPFNVYKVGEEVEVLIKKFTPDEHRIGLSVIDLKK